MTTESADRDWRIFWRNLGIGACALVVLALVGLWFFWVLFVDFVDNYELGYKFDSRTGQITILEGSGYYVTPPVLVKVHKIDRRPMQVCINANSRVLNCKLVQFDPKGVDLFLSWHGRGDYSGGGLNEILKSYAYDGSGKNYPFLRIIRELKPEEAAVQPAPQ